jgi:hypothetical protein
MWNAMGLLYSLQLLVLELEIQRLFEQEKHFGSSELLPFSDPARVPDAFIFNQSCIGAGFEGS